MGRISFVVSLIALVGVGVIAYHLAKQPRVVYVDLGKLQSGYKLKQQLEKNAEGNLTLIKNKLDSFKMVRNVVEKSSREARVTDTILARLEYEFRRYYVASNEEISSKVWERLNPAIDRYGKEHNYSVVVGANGAGNVLYGSPDFDVTADLVKYVNAVYEKGF